MMDLLDLKFLVAVYEKKGFSNAAKFLGTVQSNVSTRIRSLEISLGVQLFERRYRGVIPTDNGQRLYDRAKVVIATLDTTEREFKVPHRG